MHTIWCYQRCSTVDQSDISLDNQFNFSERIARTIVEQAPSDYVIRRVDEKETGASMEARPEFTRMNESIASGDYVFFYNVSRLARNATEALGFAKDLCRRGAFLYIGGMPVDISIPGWKMFYGMNALEAEIVLDTIHQLSKEGIYGNREDGKMHFKSTLFGWNFKRNVSRKNRNGNATINEEHAKLIRFAYEKYAEGKSMVWVADQLSLYHIPNEKDRFWRESSVRRLLTNPIYMGYYIAHPKEKGCQVKQLKMTEEDFRNSLVKSIVYPPIVSEELWWKVYYRYRAKTPHTRDFEYRYAGYECSSIFRCGECGAPANHRQVKAKNNKYKKEQIYYQYECRHHAKDCTNHVRQIKAWVLENVVKICYMISWLDGKSNALFYEKQMSELIESTEEKDTQIAEREKRLKQYEKEEANLRKAIREGFDLDGLKEEADELKHKKKEVKDEINQLEKERQQVIDCNSICVDFMTKEIRDERLEEFIDASASERREMFLKVIEYGKLYDGYIELKFLNEKRYKIYMYPLGKKIINEMQMEMYYEDKLECKATINPTAGTVEFVPNRLPLNEDMYFTQYVNKYRVELASEVNTMMERCKSVPYI